jgi:hypothetical protein
MALRPCNRPGRCRTLLGCRRARPGAPRESASAPARVRLLRTGLRARCAGSGRPIRPALTSGYDTPTGEGNASRRPVPKTPPRSPSRNFSVPKGNSFESRPQQLFDRRMVVPQDHSLLPGGPSYKAARSSLRGRTAEGCDVPTGRTAHRDCLTGLRHVADRHVDRREEARQLVLSRQLVKP